jgi:hypothetical protein
MRSLNATSAVAPSSTASDETWLNDFEPNRDDHDRGVVHVRETTIKHLRCAMSGAAGNGLGATMKYLRRTTSAAANNDMSTTIIPPCSAASF